MTTLTINRSDSTTSSGQPAACRADAHPGAQAGTQASAQADDAVTVTVTRAPVARCADGHGTLSALFFSDELVDIARAKAMCARCDLAAACLAGALERSEPWGVWGGQLIEQGRIVIYKRPRGRPPKRPRPALMVDELRPVPAHLVA